jgi:hypothetical protein
MTLAFCTGAKNILRTILFDTSYIVISYSRSQNLTKCKRGSVLESQIPVLDYTEKSQWRSRMQCKQASNLQYCIFSTYKPRCVILPCFFSVSADSDCFSVLASTTLTTVKSFFCMRHRRFQQLRISILSMQPKQWRLVSPGTFERDPLVCSSLHISHFIVLRG